MQYMSEREIDGLATATGERLRAEPKVTVVIQDDGRGGYWEGGINGHFFRIRTGEPVELPESLAKLIAENRAVLRESARRVAAFWGEGKRLGGGGQ